MSELVTTREGRILRGSSAPNRSRCRANGPSAIGRFRPLRVRTAPCATAVRARRETLHGVIMALILPSPGGDRVFQVALTPISPPARTSSPVHPPDLLLGPAPPFRSLAGTGSGLCGEQQMRAEFLQNPSPAAANSPCHARRAASRPAHRGCAVIRPRFQTASVGRGCPSARARSSPPLPPMVSRAVRHLAGAPPPHVAGRVPVALRRTQPLFRAASSACRTIQSRHATATSAGRREPPRDQASRLPSLRRSEGRSALLGSRPAGPLPVRRGPSLGTFGVRDEQPPRPTLRRLRRTLCGAPPRPVGDPSGWSRLPRAS